jgi:AraC-like DNA-binding protein
MDHTHRFALNRQQPISAEAYDFVAGHHLDEHSHAAAQLVHATSGTMSVATQNGVLIVPPERAVWIPSQVPHTIDMLSDVSMRTVYIAKGAAAASLPECRVVSVSGLLRHLILAAIDLPADYRLIGRSRALVRLLLEEISTLDQVPLFLREPTDRRLIAITERLKRNIADNRSLEAWARDANASARTLERLFAKETGLTFAQWRQQLRLIRAVGMLARKVPVTVVAMELGYATPSAFGYMFRRALGVSPKEYFGR